MKKSKKKLLTLLLLCAMCCLFTVHRDTDAAKTSYTIYVNRRSNIINVVNNRTKNVVRAMYCSTGKRYRTPRGTFHTYQKLRWHALFGGVYGQYCVRFRGSYLFHSVPYYSVNKKKVETKEYNKLGKQASKGCIRLAVVDAKWLYNNCKLGTKVVIGESKKMKKPKRNLLKISTKKKSGWDPTDPDSRNPYYPTLKLKKKSYRRVKKDSVFDPLAVIKVSSRFTDKETLLEKVTVSGKVDTTKAGSYKVKYYLTDPATLLRKKLTVTFKVVE